MNKASFFRCSCSWLVLVFVSAWSVAKPDRCQAAFGFEPLRVGLADDLPDWSEQGIIVTDGLGSWFWTMREAGHYKVSTDDGATWSSAIELVVPDAVSGTVSIQDAEFGGAGQVLCLWSAWIPSQGGNPTYGVSISLDGGLHWDGAPLRFGAWQRQEDHDLVHSGDGQWLVLRHENLTPPFDRMISRVTWNGSLLAADGFTTMALPEAPGKVAFRNPLIRLGREGRLVMLVEAFDHVRGSVSDQEFFMGSDLYASTSGDGGVDWTAPGPVFPDHATNLGYESEYDLAVDDGGTWLVLCTRPDAAAPHPFRVNVMRSRDSGATWISSDSPKPPSIYQGATGGVGIVEDGRGSWLAAWAEQTDEFSYYPMLGGGVSSVSIVQTYILTLFGSRSTDDGVTWSDPRPIVPWTSLFPICSNLPSDSKIGCANHDPVLTRGRDAVALTFALPGVIAFSRKVSSDLELNVDFTVETGLDKGWFPFILEGEGSVTGHTASGLCMSVAAAGENGAAWAPRYRDGLSFCSSPEPVSYVPLVDLAVYQATLSLSTDQTAPDAIPIFDVVYDNYSPACAPRTWPFRRPMPVRP